MSSIEEKAIALKSILKDVKKDLKKHEKVEKVPEGKTDSMEEFLKRADGKNKKSVTRKALDNLSYILMDVKKDVTRVNPSEVTTDAFDLAADKEEELRRLREEEVGDEELENSPEIKPPPKAPF